VEMVILHTFPTKSVLEIINEIVLDH